MHGKYLEYNKCNITCKTDFRKRSALDPFSINPLVIWPSLFDPRSGPSCKHSDDRGMRMMVESDDDHKSFSLASIGLN